MPSTTDAVAHATAPDVRGPRRMTRGHSHSHRRAEDAVKLRLSSGADAAAQARRALSRLRGDIDAPLLETLRLLVTELVANSVKHAAAPTIELRVLVADSSVLTEVTDDGPGFEPTGRVEGQDEASGWGLFLVERLADRWGVGRDGQRTRVWFELRRV